MKEAHWVRNRKTGKKWTLWHWFSNRETVTAACGVRMTNADDLTHYPPVKGKTCPRCAAKAGS